MIQKKREEEKVIYPDWLKLSKILSLKEKDFDTLLKEYLKSKKEVYKKIKSLKKEERDFKNTILALENSDTYFQNIFSGISIYSFTHKDKDFRDNADKFLKKLSKKSIELEYDKDLYKAFIDYYENNYQIEKNSKKSLDAIYGLGSQKLVEDYYKGYSLMGFNLSLEKQKELKEINKKLSNLLIDFSKNIDDYQDYILCEEKDLLGLPENFKTLLEKENGKYKITLDYTLLGPFLQYAESREKRKELSAKNNKKGGEKNLKVLVKIINLRNQKAKLLGFKNYIEYNLKERMVKGETEVREFLNDLALKLTPKSKEDLEKLNSFAKNNLENYKDIKSLESYDISYVANKLKENLYSYDTALIKEYFELERVLKEIFIYFGNMFSFIAEEIKAGDIRKIVVDKDVKTFVLKDKISKNTIAYLVLDLFPRDGKYGHAASSGFISEEYKEGKRVIPINQIIANFSKSTKSLPSLLALGEVNTLFHELGHALHYMLSEAKYSSQAGYNVSLDFVEAPSQMFENFLFEDKFLAKLAKHYKTNKTLDKKTREKIIKSKNFLNGYSYLRQCIFALFDLDLYTKKRDEKGIAKLYRDMVLKYQNLSLDKENIFPAGFGHLAGYGAGYYSYLYAEVYAYDFYSLFKEAKTKKDLEEIAKRFKKEILEIGGSRDEKISAEKFLKRKLNNKEFLKNLF